MIPNLFSAIADGIASVPDTLPFEAVTPAGEPRTDLWGQYEAGHLTLPDLADMDLWPATLVEVPFDAEIEAATDLVMTLDTKAKTVAAVRGKRALTAAELAEREALRNPVPVKVSAAQACCILDDDGLLDRVEAIVKAMPRAVRIWFEKANDWERASPYVMGIGIELDLSEADLDEKFRRAARRL